MLTMQQYGKLRELISPYITEDKYGLHTICSIYFDTEDDRLIRNSIEKPIYKEKLRLRSYGVPKSDDHEVFLELKKKYDSVVYKRRLTVPAKQVTECFLRNTPLPVRSQIADEIDYFREYYRTLAPRVFLSYEREAYYCPEGGDFRVTFDENILFRPCDFSMDSRIYGIPLLKQAQTLMEIKTSGGLPLWMSHALNAQ